RPVTPEVAGSSPVTRAILFSSILLSIYAVSVAAWRSLSAFVVLFPPSCISRPCWPLDRCFLSLFLGRVVSCSQLRDRPFSCGQFCVDFGYAVRGGTISRNARDGFPMQSVSPVFSELPATVGIVFVGLMPCGQLSQG
ncbi:hypothetical protein, partial [Rhizobium sp.]|uniref:hypothetical protein n=1 Tax=Rhizobium sp. TaxID=391 RepID=UPI0028A0DE4D